MKSTKDNSEGIIREFLNSALKDIMSVVSAECGSLFLFDSHNKELVLNSFYNSGQLSITGLKKKIGEGIAGKVSDIKLPILVKDIDRDLRFRRNGFNHYKTKSFISIPLFTSRGLLGLVNLADKSSGEAFSDKDLESAVAVAKYACFGVENFQDYIELRQGEEDFNKQKSLLEKYASVGKLAAGVVHEINNPLDGIIRYTNILLEQIEDNSASKEYLLEVKKGLNRIANITKSLLAFSHQVNSNASQLKKYIELHTLIEEPLEVLRSKLNVNIRIDKKYKSNLPKILDLGLSQVAANIIKNALDAMPEGGTLEISSGIKDSLVEIIFKDTGIGMPSEIRERIFEPFFTTKAIEKGTGLGLSISREIVNKYEGRIEVESSPGKGSTFTVLIPRKYLEGA